MAGAGVNGDDTSGRPGGVAMSESELERLRALVGPSETDYEALRADRDEAQEVARRAEQEAGKLRGELAEMSVQLSRARQDQDVVQRQAAMTPTARAIDRVRRRWRTSITPRIRRLTGRRVP